MPETRRTHDKMIRRIRSNHLSKDRIKRVKNIIQDLERYGPTGLIHIIILNNIIGKPIRIWNADGSLNRIVGKEKIEKPIDVEYHVIDSESMGHWTLRHAKDPDNTDIELNSCLFSVIGSQIKQAPSELRRRTVLGLKDNLPQLADQIDKIFQLEGNNDTVALMIGGARYKGKSAIDAAQILDHSQNNLHHNGTVLAHPRGHASHPTATGCLDSVENYSEKGMKTAFLSRTDQDAVAHLALKSKQVQEAMAKLNSGANRQVETIPVEILKASNNSRQIQLPQAKEYYAGKPITEEKNIKSVVIVLGHHQNLKDDPDADVFVQTFYPTI